MYIYPMLPKDISGIVVHASPYQDSRDYIRVFPGMVE